MTNDVAGQGPVLSEGLGSMAITHDLCAAIAEHSGSTGKKAERLYLGKRQVDALLKWAEDEGYREPGDSRDVSGARRPEYMGCLVYEVNDDDHLHAA